jgi:two-component system sensor histidine kinase KdpD
VSAARWKPHAGLIAAPLAAGVLLALVAFADGVTSPPVLVAVAATAAAVGFLAARADRRRREAIESRREVERLYQELQTAFDRASETEAARRNEQLKAALLDALTHNLRTPLTSIKAAVTALMGTAKWYEANLPLEARRELLQVIDEESDRLNRFIEGLSTADSRDAAKPASFATIPLHELVDAGLSRGGTITRDHRISVEIADGVPPLAVDPAAIAEVIYILLDNATKYAPAGTLVRVIGSRHDERYAMIEVADEGPGIPPLLRERVFDKFFRIRGREPLDPHRASVGLGLPIARRLVEAQGGRIWIENPASRRGTAVIMMLPLAGQAKAAS